MWNHITTCTPSKNDFSIKWLSKQPTFTSRCRKDTYEMSQKETKLLKLHINGIFQFAYNWNKNLELLYKKKTVSGQIAK